MDAFRPPGEGQKIDRIMQAFGKRYYEVMPSMGLKSTDAAYVLAFSVIMLNTDLHNTQVQSLAVLTTAAVSFGAELVCWPSRPSCSTPTCTTPR
jgi:hypothetical protein